MALPWDMPKAGVVSAGRGKLWQELVETLWGGARQTQGGVDTERHGVLS